MAVAYLQGDYLVKYEEDREKERRIALYQADVDNDPKLWLSPRGPSPHKLGMRARRVRTLDWWSLETKAPAEFASVTEACAALGVTPEEMRSSMAKSRALVAKGKTGRRCGGTRVEYVDDVPPRRVLTDWDRMVHVVTPEGLKFTYPSLTAAVNEFHVPRTTVRRKLVSASGQPVVHDGFTWQAVHESEVRDITAKFVPDGKGGLVYQWENAPAACGLVA